MMKAYDNVGSRDEIPCDLTSTALPDGAVWIDLIDPQPAELKYVEQFIKVSLPSDEGLDDLQTANRLRFDGDVVQAFTPVVFREADHGLGTTAVGFVMNSNLLVTVRTEPLLSFEDFIGRQAAPGDKHVLAPIDIFVGLLEAIVDRLSDGMERVGSDLDGVSRAIFSNRAAPSDRVKPRATETDLQETLQLIGRSGDHTSTVRDSLLGIGRLLAFVTANAADHIPQAARARVKTLRQDITSLNDYETRLTDKVQFLLDSTLGFINIDQNRTFKLLTVASVVGIPPTFVVGLYGMNFKNMPEYDWTYGYQWGLFLVAASIIAPIIWLRWRGMI